MYTFVLISSCLLRIISTFPIVSELNGSIIVCEQDSNTSEIICKQSNRTTSKEDNFTVPLCDILLDLRGNFTNCKVSVNLTKGSENLTQSLSEEDNSDGSEFLFDDNPTSEDQSTNTGEGNKDSTIGQNLQNISNNYEDTIVPTLSSLTLSLEIPVQNKRKDKTLLEKAAIGDHIDDEDYYDTSEETGTNELDSDNEDMANASKEEMEVSAIGKINTTQSEETESFDGKENETTSENENPTNSASVEDDVPRGEDTKDTIEENSNTELTNNEDLNTENSEGKEEEEDDLDLGAVEETIPEETTTAQNTDESNSDKNDEDPWFWQWLFRSLMPQNIERVKRDENSHVPSGTADVNDTSEMEEGNGSQPSDFLENPNEEDANKTMTECIGEKCDFDTGKTENETLKLENAVLESDQGEQNILNVWNTNQYVENTPWIEMEKGYEKGENEGMTHLMDDDKNHFEFEVLGIKSYELDSNSTVPKIELINILPIKISENYTELEFDVLLAKNTSKHEDMIHFHIQYGTVNLPVNTTLLLRSALNELSEMGMEEQESGGEIIVESLDERDINATSENAGEMLNFEELIGTDNDTTIFGILSSDTFVTFELHNQTIENNEIPLI